MKLRPLTLLLLLITSYACNPKINSAFSKEYPALSYKEKVTVFSINEVKPDTAEVLGEIKINDTGFTTNCSYSMVLNEAKLAARKKGGNAIKIISHKKPNFLRTCHLLEVIVLRIKNNI
jgi:hypothetical protein